MFCVITIECCSKLRNIKVNNVELICTTEQTDTTDKMVYKQMSLQPGSTVLNRRSTEARTRGTHMAVNMRLLKL